VAVVAKHTSVAGLLLCVCCVLERAVFFEKEGWNVSLSSMAFGCFPPQTLREAA